MDGMLIYHKAYKTRGVKRNFSTVSTRCFVYYWLYFLYLTPWKHSSVKNLNYDVSSKNNYGVPLSMVGIASTECKNKFMTTFLMYENIFFDGLCTFFFLGMSSCCSFLSFQGLSSPLSLLRFYWNLSHFERRCRLLIKCH